ncbi:MAG: hypothetical protein WC765_00090 [Phycisphaerae bacterium]|jgi:hypothetical protein
MNVGFYIPRDNNIKLFAAAIELLLEKGCNITLFCDYTQAISKLGYKAYQFPAVEKIPKFKKSVKSVPFKSSEEFAGIIKAEKIDVCFFLNFPPVAKDLKAILGRQGYSFIAAELQHYYDTLFLGKDLSNTDVIYCYSQNWIEWWKKCITLKNLVSEPAREQLFRDIEKKSVVTGFPEVDQVRDFKAEKIRKKYKIPDNKKMVLLIPFPYLLSSVWLNSIYKTRPAFLKRLKLMWYGAKGFLPDVRKKIDDFEVTKAIRAFCDRNNAILVVKGRIKNPVPKYVRKMADFLFFDEGFHPFTTLELLFISSLSIAFCSMTIMESALMGIPSVCIIPKPGELWPGYEPLQGMDDFLTKPGSCYNFEGIVYNESAEKFVSDFPKKSLEDYRLNSEKKKSYVEKFLGFDDYNASQRIYDDLLRRVGNSKHKVL